MKSRLFPLLLLILLPAFGWAETAKGGLVVLNVWSRASNGMSGAVYLTIENGGGDDRLIGATSPAADQVQMHIERMDNGIMEMRPLSEIDLMAGSRTDLNPGGMHLMLIGLKKPLKQGESFPLTLSFEKAGRRDVVVKIEKAGSMGEPASDGVKY